MPRESLIELWGIRDQERQDFEATQATTGAADYTKYLPPSVRALQERRQRRAQATAAGEDPRVTDFYDQQAARATGQAAYLKYLPPALAEKKKAELDERARNSFFDKNPDLDARTATETVKKDGKERSAEELVQNVLRLTMGAQEAYDKGDAMKYMAMTKDAREQYRSIKDQLTPRMRAKYSLDAFEKAGVWDAAPGFFDKDYWKQGAADLMTTPGVREAFNLLSVPQKGTSTAIAQLFRGNFTQAGQAAAGTVPTPGNVWEGARKGTTSGIKKAQVGLDVDGDGTVNLRETLGFQPTGWKEGASPAERAAGNASEFAWSTVTDPTILLSFSAGGRVKAGMQALEKEGLADIANTIRRSGWKALDETQQQVAREAIEKTVSEAIEAGAKDRGQAAKILTDIERGGRSGIRYGGRTIIPFQSPAAKAASRSSALIEEAAKVSHAELQPGHIIPRLGNSEVVSVTPGGVVIQPSDAMVTVTKTGKETVRPGDLTPGMKILDGDAVVKAVNPDGTVEVELSHRLQQAERTWDVRPAKQGRNVGGQGTLIGTKEVQAEPPFSQQGRLFDEGELRQGARAAEEAAPATPAAAKTGAEEALAKVDAAPKATGAGGFGKRIAEVQLADAESKSIGEGLARRAVDTGDGGKIIGIFEHAPDGDGELLGYLIATDDAVNTFESLTKTPGMGQKLLDAAEAEGLDVSRLLGNSDFTDAGRASARKWLRQKVATAAGDVEDVAVRGSNRTHLSATADVVLPTGGETTRRIWRRTAKRPTLPEGTLIPSVGGTVVEQTEDGVLRLRGNFTVGQELPTIQGRVISVADGVADVVPLVDDRALSVLRERALRSTEQGAAVNPVEATEGASAPVQREGASEAQSVAEDAAQGADSGTRLRDMTELGEHGAYGPKPTDTIETARRRAGRAAEAPGAPAQRPLFERETVSVSELTPGERLIALGGEVTAKGGGKGIFTVKLDDIPRTVIRGDVIDRLDSEALKVGDVLPDAGVRVTKINPDGTIELKGLIGGVKHEVRLEIGGTTQTRPSALARANDTAVPSRISRSFSPRAAVKQAERMAPERVAPGTAERLYQQTTRSAARIAHGEDELQRIVTGGWNKIRQDFGRKKAAEVVRDALDVVKSGETEAYLKRLRAAGKTNAAEGIESFLKAKAIIETAEDRFKVADELLTVRDEGLPLILTADGKRILQQDELIRRLFLGEKRVDNLTRGFEFSRNGKDLVLRLEDPNLAARVKHLRSLGEDIGGAISVDGESFVRLNLNRPVREINEALSTVINEEARRALKLPIDETLKIFDDDALTVFAMRGKSALTRAAEADMLQHLADNGAARIIRDGDEAAVRAANEAGMVEVKGFDSPLGKVFAQPEVADELGNVRAVITNDESLKAFGKAMSSFSNILARYQTSPLTKGISFQMRNSIGNAWNTTMSALHEGWIKQLPAAIAKANKLEGLSRKIGKLMEKEGLTWEEAAGRIGMAERDRLLLQGARDRGILRSGFFRNLDWETAAQNTGRVTESRVKRLGHALNPIDADFVLTKPGLKINEAIEDVHRLAHYIGVLEHTGSVDEAVASVRKYLFDYNDLTPFERKVMRNINRFYTFMRKNTALQASLLAQRPGLVGAAYRLKSDLFAPQTGLEGGLYPGEQQDGTFKAGGWAEGIFGGPGVMQIETPLDAAIRTVDPFFQTAVYGLHKAGIDLPIPASEQPTMKSIVGGFMDTQTSGGPAALIDLLYTYRTGTDTFTGRPVSESDTGQKLVQTFFPLYGQGKKTAENWDDRANLLRLVTGINYHVRDESTRQSLQYAWVREMEDTIARLQDEGVDVPTIGEMQDAGLLPSDAELNAQFPEARTVELTPEQKRQKARQSLGLPPG